MKQSYLIVCLLCFFTATIQGQVPKTLFFENSALPYGFSRSLTTYEGHSWIKNFHKKLPVSEAIFFTPGTSLALTYKSDSAGYWQADVYANSSKGFRVPPSSYLHLKLLVKSNETGAAQLPSIQLIQGDNHVTEALRIERYLSDYKAGQWLSIKIRLSDFANVRENAPFLGVRFAQGARGKQEHRMYLDQIEILPHKLPDSKLTGAAVLSSITSFERHAVLQWKLPLTPSIRYIQIYRSENNKDFDPIAIRTIPAMTYTDILPDTTKTYYYKVAWMDYGYERSPYSAVKTAKSIPMNDEALLNMVQEAHIRYCLSGEEFNSGLQKVNRHLADAKVSTKGTGLGIMAMVVGVRHQMLSREQLRAKIDRICDFLLQTETFQGAFPAIIDGRDGQYAGEETIAGADLEATAYLMQGLLVARSYFDGRSAEEENLRKKITTLWRNVQWNKFKKDGTHYLYSGWTPVNGFAQAHPLSGQHTIPIYIMAMASPTFNIDIEDYERGMAKPMVFRAYKKHTVDSIPMLIPDSILSQKEMTDMGTWVSEPYENGQIYQGVPLAVGHPKDALSRLLMAFAAFDPRNKSDQFTNYYQNINHLIRIQERLKAEQTNGFLTLTRGIPISTAGLFSNALDFNSEVALYGFNPEKGLRNLKRYYLDFPHLCWSENGFKSRFDADKNQYVYVEDAAYKALVPVMIENGKDGMIWDLFMKAPEIQTIVMSLFYPR